MNKTQELKYWKNALTKCEANKKALEFSKDYDKKSEEYKMLHGYYSEKIPRLQKRIEKLEKPVKSTAYSACLFVLTRECGNTRYRNLVKKNLASKRTNSSFRTGK